MIDIPAVSPAFLNLKEIDIQHLHYELDISMTLLRTLRQKMIYLLVVTSRRISDIASHRKSQ